MSEATSQVRVWRMHCFVLELMVVFIVRSSNIITLDICRLDPLGARHSSYSTVDPVLPSSDRRRKRMTGDGAVPG